MSICELRELNELTKESKWEKNVSIWLLISKYNLSVSFKKHIKFYLYLYVFCVAGI